MDWLEVTVRTTTSGAEIISETLIGAGSAGTSIEDRNDVFANQRPEGQWDIIDEALADKMGEDVLVKGYFQMDDRLSDVLSGLRDSLERLKSFDLGDIDLGKMTVETSTVREADWADSWKQYYKPFRVGERFVIKPTWEQYAAKPADKIIEIDPGMAFGTGTHETTSMCLEYIEQFAGQGMSVLDVGSGTGILSIGAAMCGASNVVAIDIDPMAVRITRDNAAINGVSGIISPYEGNLTDTPLADITGNDNASMAFGFDIVVANIISDVVMALAPVVRGLMKDGAVFITSGIITEREDEVVEALKSSGYDVIDIKRMGSWSAIAARAGR